MSVEPSRIAANLAEVRGRVAAACARSGRRPEELRLVAVTKTVGVEEINSLLALGQMDIGESRVQDALVKRAAAGPGARWHMIGHLQRNKVKRALELFDAIHSVDSERLALTVSQEALSKGTRAKALLEVNTSACLAGRQGEESKFGLAEKELFALVRKLADGGDFRGLEAVGLMTMGPLSGDPEAARSCFRRLAQLRAKVGEIFRGGGFSELSMGMTGDFEAAVEEGATMLRIGTALFK